MKWFFSIILIIFLTQPLFSSDFEAQYQIKTRGVKIGSLKWELDINGDTYKTTIDLKNKGLLSALYEFKGTYTAIGKIKNNFLFSKEYNQFWKTKKKKKIVKLTYNNEKIEKLILFPVEKEKPRIKYKNLKNYNDPLTSFLNILLNQKPSYTIDGRRAYLLNPIKKEGGTKILIEEYVNIWADHKRNDLGYIEIYLEKKQYLPKKINIMFGGSIFSLNKI